MSRQRKIPAELIESLDHLAYREHLRQFGAEFWNEAIRYILSAIEDGEIRLGKLPPLGTLPWEVERKSWLHYKYVFRGQTEWLRSLPEGNLILIAFLPEEIEPLGRSL